MSRHVATFGRRQLPDYVKATTITRNLGIPRLRSGGSTNALSGASLGSFGQEAARSYHGSTWNALAHGPWTAAPRLVDLGIARGVPQSARGWNKEIAWSGPLSRSVQRRWNSDKASSNGTKIAQEAHRSGQTPKPSEKATGAAAAGDGSYHILERLPHIHRPTKEELLSAATGFWHRLGIRFKWFTIRSGRPYKIDEIFAFASWIFWGHVLWIVVGTTTFVSLAIFTVNTVFAQETLARWVGNYLTKSSGVKVVFESAIVPKWDAGVITFNNVFVSRRPGKLREKAVSKGSSTEAAAAAANQARDEIDPEEDTNYSQYDVTIDTVNVTLSFTKWFNGKGLLRDVEVKGVRGVLDRTSVHSTGEYVDPKSYRHEHNTGDFEMDTFKMSDVLITVYQPNDFRPFTASVFSCELPRLRKQWLFYDFLSANTMSGSFDNSLFTIHPVQSHGHTGIAIDSSSDATGDPRQWKKQSRLRIDGLKIDHLNRGVEGPFSWIQEGNVDIVADLNIPHDLDESLTKVIGDFYDRMEATVSHVHTPFHTHREREESGNVITHSDEQQPGLEPAKQHPTAHDWASSTPQDDTRFIILDLRVHLNDVRASVPIFTKDLSYVNYALVRPIVAYINSKRAFIPVHCRVVKRQSEFDGSWTIFDSGLLDDLSRETYEAFSRDIADGERTVRRFKKVGLWTLQVAAQALFIGLVGQVA